MIVQTTGIHNVNNALYAMRNPHNSWGSSDMEFKEGDKVIYGQKDLQLSRGLTKAGSDHRKHLRLISISAIVKAPLYWWKQFDTYKIGTVRLSTSTMHRIMKDPIVLNDFECIDKDDEKAMEVWIKLLNRRIKQKKFDSVIKLLPSSYKQLADITMTGEALLNIVQARRTHKLPEWRLFCEQIIEQLPVLEDLMGSELTGV